MEDKIFTTQRINSNALLYSFMMILFAFILSRLICKPAERLSKPLRLSASLCKQSRTVHLISSTYPKYWSVSQYIGKGGC